jgi:hypothetical protein
MHEIIDRASAATTAEGTAAAVQPVSMKARFFFGG